MNDLDRHFESIKDCEYIYLYNEKHILDNIIIRNEDYIAKLFSLDRNYKITVYNIMLLSKSIKSLGGLHQGSMPIDYSAYVKSECLIPKPKSPPSYEIDYSDYFDYIDEMRILDFVRWH